MNPNKSHWRYNCTVILSFAKVSSLFKQWLALQAVWPDLVIYYTLGNFSKPRSTIILPTHILGNFCKSVKIFHFTKEILFGQLLLTFGQLFTGHAVAFLKFDQSYLSFEFPKVRRMSGKLKIKLNLTDFLKAHVFIWFKRLCFILSF